MPDSVDSSSTLRIGRKIIAGSRISIGPKPEELTAAGPMKGCGTGWVSTLGMQALVERSALDCFAVAERWLIASWVNSAACFFEMTNRRTQPYTHRFRDLAFVIVAIDRIERFPRLVQGDMTARRFRGAKLRRYQLHQRTFGTRTRIVPGIIVNASGRVFENKLRPPWCFDRT